MATQGVTVADFRHFTQDRRITHAHSETLAPKDYHPISYVSWYRAAEYCNWLSRKEGLAETEWCYEPHPQRGYATGMQMKADYLKRTGYRLPTESEWEYACRAGAAPSRYYDETDARVGAGEPAAPP
jgi:formylglycine-generating enzyme required for sulfatase activity